MTCDCPPPLICHALPDVVDEFGLPGMDGVIGTLDMLFVFSRWGPCYNCCCRGDIDRDGQIDTRDFLLVVGAWGQKPWEWERCR